MKCKVEKICGGCSLLKLKPSMQADKKKKDVEELVDSVWALNKLDLKSVQLWICGLMPLIFHVPKGNKLF